MWKLISDSLPIAPTKRLGAPIATVRSRQSLAPVCRIATEGESFDLPMPQDVGNYFYLELPSSRMEILSASSLTRNWRREAKAGTYWESGDRVGAVNTSDSVTFSIKATTFVPPHVEYLYQLNLSTWGDIEVTGLSSEGMKFFPAADPENLSHPEWKFENSILSFRGEDICAPRSGGELEISFDITVDTFTYRVIKFQFPNSVRDCDYIEYLGYTYQITAERFPEKHEFFWSYPDRTAYVFN